MDRKVIEAGREELRSARRESRNLYWFVAIFGFFANLLGEIGGIDAVGGCATKDNGTHSWLIPVLNRRPTVLLAG